MLLEPTHASVYNFDDSMLDESMVFDSCDSAVAVLTDDQLNVWFAQFKDLAEAEEETGEYNAYGTRTLVFSIDGEQLVVVSDSGGEIAAGEFELFCEENGITCQTIIDSLDCTDVPVEDIYTGTMDEDAHLLSLVHKLYN